MSRYANGEPPARKRERMREFLIVDGYNIIGAWPELMKLKVHDLEDARDRLIEMLAEFAGFSGFKVIIVFDAHQVPGLGKKYEQSRLEVLYTKEKETADECIERLVDQLMRRRVRIHVATSDLMEQHVIFGKGALRISSRELLIMVKQIEGEIQKQIIPERNFQRVTFDSAMKREIFDIFENWRRGK